MIVSIARTPIRSSVNAGDQSIVVPDFLNTNWLTLPNRYFAMLLLSAGDWRKLNDGSCADVV
ncbi:MAG: hypothetical protein ACRERD_30345 [Candidatus Binatia bacterium]